MNILIIGASQGTGAEAVKNALARDHSVSAFARNPAKLAARHPNLRLLAGDFHRPESLAGAVPGHDAVIVTASANSLKAFRENPNYFSQGTSHVIDAMRASSLKRLVVLSAFGVGESRKLAPFWLDALVISRLLKVPFEDHERQERLVMDSGLDWVIARPGRLSNGPARQRYVAKTAVERVPSSISRADVADFLVRAATDEARAQGWLGNAVQLGG